MSIEKVAKYILLIIILVTSGKYTIDAYEILTNNRLQQVQQQVTELQNKQQQILESIEYKKSDFFVEEFARNDLQMIKPNEDVFIVKKGDVALNNQSVLPIDYNNSQVLSMQNNQDASVNSQTELDDFILSDTNDSKLKNNNGTNKNGVGKNRHKDDSSGGKSNFNLWMEFLF